VRSRPGVFLAAAFPPVSCFSILGLPPLRYFLLFFLQCLFSFITRRRLFAVRSLAADSNVQCTPFTRPFRLLKVPLKVSFGSDCTLLVEGAAKKLDGMGFLPGRIGFWPASFVILDLSLSHFFL